jgi:uncharacterized membrane protein
VVVAGAICGLIALIQLNSLKQNVALLKAKVIELQSSLAMQKHTQFANADTTSHQPAIVTAKVYKPEPTALAQVIQPQTPGKASVNTTLNAKLVKPSSIKLLFNKLRTGFEQNWMTWIGAIALAFGGILLAKYSLEAGLLSPVMRLSLGGVFGLGLIAAAAYLHHKRIALKTLLDNNPLFTSIHVGECVVFNWLLVLWLVPAGCVFWLSILIKPVNAKVILLILAIAGAFTLLAINSFIRQYWQGPYIYLAKGFSHAELYSYSIIWLILGAGTVIVGDLKISF